MQIIVSDHANLTDAWFADAVKHNWRDGAELNCHPGFGSRDIASRRIFFAWPLPGVDITGNHDHCRAFVIEADDDPHCRGGLAISVPMIRALDEVAVGSVRAGQVQSSECWSPTCTTSSTCPRTRPARPPAGRTPEQHRPGGNSR